MKNIYFIFWYVISIIDVSEHRKKPTVPLRGLINFECKCSGKFVDQRNPTYYWLCVYEEDMGYVAVRKKCSGNKIFVQDAGHCVAIKCHTTTPLCEETTEPPTTTEDNCLEPKKLNLGTNIDGEKEAIIRLEENECNTSESFEKGLIDPAQFSKDNSKEESESDEDDECTETTTEKVTIPHIMTTECVTDKMHENNNLQYVAHDNEHKVTLNSESVKIHNGGYQIKNKCDSEKEVHHSNPQMHVFEPRDHKQPLNDQQAVLFPNAMSQAHSNIVENVPLISDNEDNVFNQREQQNKQDELPTSFELESEKELMEEEIANSTCQNHTTSTTTCPGGIEDVTAWFNTVSNKVHNSETTQNPTNKHAPDLINSISKNNNRPFTLECMSEGTFADPQSCMNYFVCRPTKRDINELEAIHMQCPSGTAFDSKSLKCTKDALAACMEKESDLNDSSWDYIRIKKSLPKNKSSFLCINEGRHADPEDCSNYHLCVRAASGVGYDSFKFRCPRNTLFDPNVEQCVDAKDAKCGITSHTTVTSSTTSN